MKQRKASTRGHNMEKDKKTQTAIALEYDPSEVAPKIIATGKGIVAEKIIEKLDIEEAIKKADVVITGEGRIDNQTASGKGPGRIAQLGKQYGCFVVGFSGILNMPYDKCLEIMDDIKQIKPENMPKDEAKKVENAIQNMKNAVTQYFTINM